MLPFFIVFHGLFFIWPVFFFTTHRSAKGQIQSCKGFSRSLVASGPPTSHGQSYKATSTAIPTAKGGDHGGGGRVNISQLSISDLIDHNGRGGSLSKTGCLVVFLHFVCTLESPKEVLKLLMCGSHLRDCSGMLSWHQSHKVPVLKTGILVTFKTVS